MKEPQLSWRVAVDIADQDAESCRACAEQGTERGLAWGVYIR